MKKRIILIISLIFPVVSVLYAQNVAGDKPDRGVSSTNSSIVPSKEGPSLEEQRLKIIRYGTDTEIANLIKILRNEQPSDPPAAIPIPETQIDKELFTLMEKTKNRAILSGIFGYFSDREIGGLEKRALAAVKDRDYEAAETVIAAIYYLGKLRVGSSGSEEASAKEAGQVLMDIMNGEENRFLSVAIRSLGQIGEKNKPEETAEYLMDYYASHEMGEENRRLLVVAVGDTKAKEGASFLVSIAENEDERAVLRIAALEALAKIADISGLPTLINAVSSKDPNVRASAVGSLGPFPGEEADAVIIEAFRDSFYRTRIAAAKAAGERKLAASVPFLRFRCENDEIPAVRDEAIKALGFIGGKEAEQILMELFKERKNSDRIRINAGEMLLTKGSADYITDVIIELDEAKKKNQTALYNGFLRILGEAKSPKLEELARRFFAAGGVVEKSYALDFCSRNNFRGLVDEVRKLTDTKNGSLSRKSLALLEEWGLPVTRESSSLLVLPVSESSASAD
jgi:HEAT repeat protein